MKNASDVTNLKRVFNNKESWREEWAETIRTRQMSKNIDDMLNFIPEYQHKWQNFAHFFGLAEHEDLKTLLCSLSTAHSTVSVSHGYGCGVSTAAAMLSIIHTILNPLSNTIIIGNERELNSIDKYINVLYRELSTRLPSWFGEFYYSNRGLRPRSLIWQGATFLNSDLHEKEGSLARSLEEYEHKPVMFIVLGAVNIPDDALSAVYRLTRPGQYQTRAALFSRPSRKDGFFYKTHHISEFGYMGFTPFVWSAERSPLVTENYLAMKEEEYGGRDNDGYRINVMGQFPLGGVYVKNNPA